MSAPVDWLTLYGSKLLETAVHASWMVGLLALPIVTAYGVVYSGGWMYPFVVLAGFVPFLLIPAALGSMLTLLLVNVFPARRTRDILGQFLVEAVTLSLIGGLAGVALGIGTSLLIAELAGWRVLLSAQAVGLAVAFAFVIGVFFGFYPARKAARLNPVEALRFE